jgi:hypothetical protein
MNTKKQLLISMANNLNEVIQAASNLHNSSLVERLEFILEDVEEELSMFLAQGPKPMGFAKPKKEKVIRSSCADLDTSDRRGIRGRSWEGSKFWDLTEEDFSRLKEEHIAP